MERKAFLLEAGCVESKGRRGRQPWKPRNMLPLWVDLEEGVSERVLYKMESVSGNLTSEESLRAARKLMSQYGVKHETTLATYELGNAILVHRDLLNHTPGPVVVQLSVRTLLPGKQLLFQDKPWWDLNAPRSSIEQYAASVCGDLGLSMPCYVRVARAMKDAVDKAKQEVAIGKLQAGQGPEPGLNPDKQEVAKYPNVVTVTPEQLEQIRKALAAKAAADAAAQARAAEQAAAQAAAAAAAAGTPEQHPSAGPQPSAGAASSGQPASATAASQPDMAAAGAQPPELVDRAAAVTSPEGWASDDDMDMPDLDFL